MAKLGTACGKVNRAPEARGGTRDSGVRHGLDAAPREPLSYPARLVTNLDPKGAVDHEAHVSASKPQAFEQARLPGPYEDPGRPQDPQFASPEGSGSPHGEDRLEVTDVSAAGPPAHSPGTGGPSGQRLPRATRLRSAREIREVRNRGKRTKTRHLDVFFAPSPVSHSRLGIVVPKHGYRIVDRNRLKRRLREIGRRELLPRLRTAEAGIDLLVRARREAYQAPFAELRAQLVELVEERWCAES